MLILLINPIQSQPTVYGHQLEQRLVFINNDFLITNNQQRILDVVNRAADNCFTGIVIGDAKFGLLNTLLDNEIYMRNLNSFLDEATNRSLDIFPSVVNFGYSSPLLFHDPNLAEGLPVVDAPFVVQRVNNELVLLNDPTDNISIKNKDFETQPSNGDSGDIIPGWNGQDKPGRITFWDNSEAHSGRASLRVVNPKNNNGLGRLSQRISVTPFRDYYISVWVKTKSWESGLVQLVIQNIINGRELQYNPLKVATDQDWTKYEFTFNTLDSKTVDLFLGAWNGNGGTLWFDDIQIRPTRFNNIIRRSGTPVVVKSENGQVLQEASSIGYLEDPLCGTDPYRGSYSVWHQQPTIKIPNSSSLSEGDKVLISYYHTAIINGNQSCASLTEPKALDISAQQMTWVKDLMEQKGIFKGWFLGHNEIRINNWDESPNFGSPGNNLAYNVSEIYERAKRIDASADLMIWSDLFDEFHNASSEVDPYYLVKGSWKGSWEGLPKDVTIFNWQYTDRVNSAAFFAKKGYEQILCGYYDQPSFYTKDWLRDLEGKEGVKGVMFTTWENDYSQLENWARETWGTCDAVVSNNTTVAREPDVVLSAYPNPATGDLNIEVPDPLIIKKVFFFDIRGKVVLEENNLSSGLVNMQTSNLPTGFYTIVVHTNGGIYQKKTSIQK